MNDTPPDYDALREQMVQEQLIQREISDFRVINAMRRVPRHEFVPEAVRHLAYRDGALPIDQEQTISQPYIVALMLQMLQLSGHETVLEIGTGSGYQTALLCEIVPTVYTVERYPELAESAQQRLHSLGYANFDLYVGDGSQGLADMAPYDAIVVSAAVPRVPPPLQNQLGQVGRMVLPLGGRKQQYLHLLRRDFDQWEQQKLLAVRFVPLVGMFGFPD